MEPIKICKVEGCTTPVHSRGFCNKHYLRERSAQRMTKLPLCPFCHSKNIKQGRSAYVEVGEWDSESYEEEYFVTEMLCTFCNRIHFK